MKEYNGIPLPVVSVEIDDDLASCVKRAKMPVEGAIELVIYLQREKAKCDVLNEAIAEARAKVNAVYDSTKEDERETIRAGAGMATYSKPGEKVQLKDRDATVEALSNEQIRITYQPDIKALKTILKKDEYDRLTETVATPSRIAIKDTKGEFEEF